MVRSGGLEPPRMLLHSDLNAARLPIPPRPQVRKRVEHLAKRSRHLKRKMHRSIQMLAHERLCGTTHCSYNR